MSYSEKTERAPSVDVLKGICVIMVVITHYSWSDEQRSSLLFPFWINMAVPVFMILSGYVMTLSLDRRNIKHIEGAYTKERIIRSLLRFTVPFTAAFITEAILDIFVYQPRSLGDYFILFLQGGAGQGSYYFPIMIQFIFVFPVIYFIVKRDSKKGILLCFIIDPIYEILKTVYCMNEECYRLLVFRYVFAVASGVYAASCKNRLKKFHLLISVFIGMMYIFVTMYISYTPVILEYWTNTSLFSVFYIFPLIYWILSYHRSSIIFQKFRLLKLIGKASYNIFLVQMVYYGYCSGYVYQMLSGASDITVIPLIVNVIICCVVGIAFYFAETPVTRKCCKLFIDMFSKHY